MAKAWNTYGKSATSRRKRPGVKLSAPPCLHGALCKACPAQVQFALAAGETAVVRPLKQCLGLSGRLLGYCCRAAVGVMCEGQMLIILKISSSLLNPLLLQGQKNKMIDDKVLNMTAEPWSQAQDRHEISHQDTGMGVWVGKMSLHLYVYLPPSETDSGM